MKYHKILLIVITVLAKPVIASNYDSCRFFINKARALKKPHLPITSILEQGAINCGRIIHQNMFQKSALNVCQYIASQIEKKNLDPVAKKPIMESFELNSTLSCLNIIKNKTFKDRQHLSFCRSLKTFPNKKQGKLNPYQEILTCLKQSKTHEIAGQYPLFREDVEDFVKAFVKNNKQAQALHWFYDFNLVEGK